MTRKQQGRTTFSSVTRHCAVGLAVVCMLAVLALPAVAPGQTIAVSTATGLVIMEDGTVWGWGDNTYGQLGTGDSQEQLIAGPGPDLTGVVAVVSAGWHSLALLEDGTVWASGWNLSGELGNGTSGDPEYSPLEVSGLTDVVAIDGNSDFSMALKSDGTVWAWGDNTYGNLGDGTKVKRHTPVQVSDLTDVIAISAGWDHGLALKSDGTVWTWGNNSEGYLGDGTTEERLTPVQVRGLENVVAIDCEWAHRLALTRDGTVMAWGDNLWGQLGREIHEDWATPAAVPELDDVIAIAASSTHSMAIRSDGTAWAWGSNIVGQLGNGEPESTPQPTPVRVFGLTGVVEIEGGYTSSHAILADGTVWAWGLVESGGLGDGMQEQAEIPYQVFGGVRAPDVEITGGIEWVSSYRVAIGSHATVDLWCPGAVSGARVVLEDAAGVQLEADASIESDGHGRAIFDLTDATAGSYELLVINPDDEEFTGAQPFTLQAERNLNLWVSVLARDSVRIGEPQAFNIAFGNTGNIDAVALPLWITGIPLDAEWELGVELSEPVFNSGGMLGDALDFDDFDKHITGDDEIAIPLVIPVLPAGGTGNVRLLITIPSEREFELAAQLNAPYYSSPLNSAWQECMEAAAENFLLRLPPGVDCAYGVTQLAESAVEWRKAKGFWAHVDFAIAWVDAAVQCSTEFTAAFPPAAAVAAVFEAVLDVPLALYGTVKDCIKALKKDKKNVNAIGSIDPNEKVAASGVGAGKYLRSSEPLRYAVFFENLESASAAARDVVITDQLDPETMDLDTLQLGLITFGDRMIEPPPGLREYSTEVDLRPEMNLLVDIDVTLDAEAGVLTWVFTSLDPDTGETPEDAEAGFLPPNVNPPEGDGSVLFTVMPVADLTTGTEIRNEASIVFDVNPPIETGEVLNTIDIGPPSSEVAALPNSQTETDVAVSWGGDDGDGCGIESYTIYVSEDGGEPTVWLENTAETSATFSGTTGHRYSFYSMASDLLGHEEPAPEAADATVEIRRASSGGGGGGGLCGMGMLPAVGLIAGALALACVNRRRRA